MSSELRLKDGTEFKLRFASSERAVVVGFEEGDLEKLLQLKPGDLVSLDGRERAYEEAERKIGKIAAYVPSETDYFRICNRL